MPGVVTGKPLIIGGSAGRREATGRGIVYALYQAARQPRAGAAGPPAWSSRASATSAPWRRGCSGARAAVIAGVSDVKGGDLESQRPRHPPARSSRGRGRHAWSASRAPSRVTNTDLLTLPCDVLIPAAIGSVRSTRTTPIAIKATIVAEGANGPTTPEADVILRDRGVTVIPDILSNAGGVVVSYFEWVQGLQYYFWRESEITARLQEVMTRAFNRVWALGSKEGSDLRTAALMEGIRRVAEGYKVRGLYP